MTDSGASASNPRDDHVPGSAPLAPRSPERDRVHWARLHVMWLIEMAIAEPLLWFLLYKHLPPGSMSSSANGVRFDTIVATMLANAAVAAVIIYFIYAMILWRQPKGEAIKDGPALRTHLRVQFWWVFITAGIVIGAFVFGTYELIVPAGAGSGEGPSPIWAPTSGKVLPIQVIGQQWYWTYRYPTFGGFETTQLYVPNNTQIAFHVTSLDVVHNWWAYQLSIKADANPGVDNVAFTTTYQTGRFQVRCDELCGIWHGAMYNAGYVVTKKAFMEWGTRMEKRLAPLTKLLPKFSWTYAPSANSADGGYYSVTSPFYKYLTYGNGKSTSSGLAKGVHVKASGTPASKGVVTGSGTPFERLPEPIEPAHRPTPAEPKTTTTTKGAGG